MGQRMAPKHPMGNVGGFQMPDVGDLGGAKGVGHVKQQQQQQAGDAKVGAGAAWGGGRDFMLVASCHKQAAHRPPPC